MTLPPGITDAMIDRAAPGYADPPEDVCSRCGYDAADFIQHIEALSRQVEELTAQNARLQEAIRRIAEHGAYAGEPDPVTVEDLEGGW